MIHDFMLFYDACDVACSILFGQLDPQTSQLDECIVPGPLHRPVPIFISCGLSRISFHSHSLRQVNVDPLDLLVLADAVGTEFAPDPAGFEASEGHRVVEKAILVDPNCTGLESSGDASRLSDVVCEDASAETKLGVVGEFQSFRLSLEGDHADDGAEDLFSHYPHVGARVREDRGTLPESHVVAFRAAWLQTTRHDRGALVEPGLDVGANFVPLCRGDLTSAQSLIATAYQRTHGGRLIIRLADSARLCALLQLSDVRIEDVLLNVDLLVSFASGQHSSRGYWPCSPAPCCRTRRGQSSPQPASRLPS